MHACSGPEKLPLARANRGNCYNDRGISCTNPAVPTVARWSGRTVSLDIAVMRFTFGKAWVAACSAGRVRELADGSIVVGRMSRWADRRYFASGAAVKL